MTAQGGKWLAIWQRDGEHWVLLITDREKNIRFREKSCAPVHSPHPRDGRLISLGFTPAGEWRRDEEDGSFFCEVKASRPGNARLLRAREAG